MLEGETIAYILIMPHFLSCGLHSLAKIKRIFERPKLSMKKVVNARDILIRYTSGKAPLTSPKGDEL